MKSSYQYIHYRLHIQRLELIIIIFKYIFDKDFFYKYILWYVSLKSAIYESFFQIKS